MNDRGVWSRGGRARISAAPRARVLVVCLALAPAAEAGEGREILLLSDIEVRAALERGIEEFARQSDGRVRFTVSGPGEMPFADGSFDLVVSVAALPLWRDKAAVFREVHRVLKPGGVAFLGGRYLHMPEWRKVSGAELRRVASSTGLPGIRVVEDMGQWVEIRKPRR